MTALRPLFKIPSSRPAITTGIGAPFRGGSLEIRLQEDDHSHSVCHNVYGGAIV